MRRALGLVAAAVLGGVPSLLWPEWHLVAACVAAASAAAGGIMLPSLSLALVGAILAIFAFAVALLTVPAGNALPAALLMGAAVLAVLELSALEERAGRAGLGPGLLRATLARLGATISLAAACTFLLAVPAALLPLRWSGQFRPLVALGGALMAFAAAAGPFLQPYTMRRTRKTVGTGSSAG